jgi:hypothetical protein
MADGIDFQALSNSAHARRDAWFEAIKPQLVAEAYEQGVRSSQEADEFARWFVGTYTLDLRAIKVPEHLLGGVAWRAFCDRRVEPTKQREGDQPLPVRNDLPCIQDLVMADIEARKKIGVERYGTTLQPHNQRDVLQDLYEELMDALMYVKQAMYERDHPRET